MTSPIHPLESVLVLLAIAYPAGAGFALLSLLRSPVPAAAGPRAGQARPSVASGTLALGFGYVVALGLVALLRPARLGGLELTTAPWFWYLLAPLLGLACIAIDYALSVGLFYLRTRRIETRVGVHEVYSEAAPLSVADLLAVLLLVVAEELVFRHLFYHVLVEELAVSLTSTFLIGAAIYALIHVRFGRVSVLSKFLSGALLLGLYYWSGTSLLVVVLAHAVQNIALLLWSHRGAA